MNHLLTLISARGPMLLTVVRIPVRGAILLLALIISPRLHADDVSQLAARIDELIEQRLATEHVTPAPLADDAEFLRRVSLDLCGKIPPAAEVRDFLADADPDKRAKLVNRLLGSPAYIIHSTNLWRAAMIPEADAEADVRTTLPPFEAWLRSRLAENRNFAQIVEEMLTLPVASQDPRVLRGLQAGEASPAAFYGAKEQKPELLAAATARLFLGVRIDCAQCHDHPFDSWKQDQFWQHAAFFTDLPQATPPEGIVGQMQQLVRQPGTIRVGETERTVPAKFLDGVTPQWDNGETRRALAEWIIKENNPWFARAAVNRVWSYHFGIGLVEPMDDFSPMNPPSHPELLDELARAFVTQKYDFKFLIRAITASRAYQRASRLPAGADIAQVPSRLFDHMPVRGLTPEQIFDSLAQATGYRQLFDPEQPINFNNDQSRQEIISLFANSTESATDRTSTILQALALMNGRFVEDATDIADSRTLAAVIDAPFLDAGKKVDALTLATLTRYPTQQERQKFVDYIQSAPGGTTPAALADVFWVLLNSSEFLLNH